LRRQKLDRFANASGDKRQAPLLTGDKIGHENEKIKTLSRNRLPRF
jgi:hypothetical protein